MSTLHPAWAARVVGAKKFIVTVWIGAGVWIGIATAAARPEGRRTF